MADYIMDFNMSDGLAPLVMQKLNANFHTLAKMRQAESDDDDDGGGGSIDNIYYDPINGILYVWHPIEGTFQWVPLVTEDGTVAKAISDALGNDIPSTYATKADLASVYRYRGSVADETLLPSSPSIGDVYNIMSSSSYGGAGMNVAWDGNGWDALGGVVQVLPDCPFPVGYVMQMTNGSDPNFLYPGTTWTQINGVFLLGSSNSHVLGATGGTETHNHNNGKTGSTTLTAAQSGLPAHTHGFTNPKIPNHVHTMSHGHGFTQPKVHRAQNAGSGTNRYAIQGADDSVNVAAFGGAVTNYTGNTGNPTTLGSTTGGSVGAVTNGAQAASSGHDHSIEAADNMPPYKVVNMWERTA